MFENILNNAQIYAFSHKMNDSDFRKRPQIRGIPDG